MKNIEQQCEHSDLSVQLSNVSCSFYFPISLVKNRNCSASHWRTVSFLENERLAVFQLHDMICETTMFICLNKDWSDYTSYKSWNIIYLHYIFHHTLHPESDSWRCFCFFPFTYLVPLQTENYFFLFHFIELEVLTVLSPTLNITQTCFIFLSLQYTCAYT